MSALRALFLGLLAGCAAGPETTGSQRACPNFTLADTEGRTYRLYEALREGPALLWMTNCCATCQARFPFVERLSREHAGRLAVFAISVLGTDRDTPAELHRQQHATFPMLLDPEDWVGRYLGFVHIGNACPVNNAILVRRDATIAWRGHLSSASDEDVLAAVRELLAN